MLKTSVLPLVAIASHLSLVVDNDKKEKLAGYGGGCQAPGNDAQNILAAARRVISGGQDETGEVASCFDGKGHPDFLSFKRILVGAAGSATAVQRTSLTVRSNIFQGQRLWFAESIATGLLIRQLKVGSKDILNLDEVNDGWLPAELFSSRAQTCPQLPFCPAPTSQVISIEVENITDSDIMALIGLQGISA